MKKLTTYLATLLFICLLSTITIAQISSPKIDSLMAESLIKFKVAGAAIAIVKDGKPWIKLHRPGVALLCAFKVALVFESATEQKVRFSVIFPPERLLFLCSSPESLFLSLLWLSSRIG
jgi:hypothetical protein